MIASLAARLLLTAKRNVELRAAGGPGSGPHLSEATRIAREATAKANASGTPLDHSLAAVAHDAARQAHLREGNKVAADAHQRYVEVHRGKMKAAAAIDVSRRDETLLHKAADANYRQMLLVVSAAFMRGRKAYKSGGADAAVKAIRASLNESLPPVLLKAVKAGGDAGIGRLPRGRTAMRALAPFDFRFDATDPNVIKWAKEHAAELAKDLSDTSLQAIRDAIASAMAGDGIDAAYDDILAAVGDEARASTIARTEVMAAANEGNRQGWAQAVDAGLLDDATRVEWIATSDACPECDALDGTTRPIDGEYDDPDAGDGPPLHPNCRCTEGIAS